MPSKTILMKIDIEGTGNKGGGLLRLRVTPEANYLIDDLIEFRKLSNSFHGWLISLTDDMFSDVIRMFNRYTRKDKMLFDIFVFAYWMNRYPSDVDIFDAAEYEKKFDEVRDAIVDVYYYRFGKLKISSEEEGVFDFVDNDTNENQYEYRKSMAQVN